MIDALVQGKLYGVPEQAIGKSGNSYTRAQVRVWTADGSSVLCGVIAFEEEAQGMLLALSNGDSVSLSGAAVPKVIRGADGEYRPGMDIVAHRVLTTFDVRRKRQAIERAVEGGAPPE